MLIRHAPDIRSSEVTPKSLFLRRRELLAAAGAIVAGTVGALFDGRARAQSKLEVAKRVSTTPDPPSPHRTVTTFNNFYEFGSDKNDPARNANSFRPKPWSVEVEGECARPGTYALEDILKPHPLEERVYRLRCVEGWSIVVPWVGFPLGDLLKRFEPTGRAQYVEFFTVVRPQEMSGQRQRYFSAAVAATSPPSDVSASSSCARR